MEIGVPALMQYLNNRENANSEEIDADDITEVEKESFKDKYDALLGTFSDYAELMMQFGYTTLFIASFPLASIMSLVSGYVEIRVDAWKLCQICRRPEPMGCEDIGTWQTILELMSLASVLSNAALIAYTSTINEDYSWTTRNWIFFGVVILCIGGKSFIDLIVPDEPKDVRIQKERSKYAISKVIYDAEDDIEFKMDATSLKAEFKVRVIDDDPL
jgi:hypothetical protein